MANQVSNLSSSARVSHYFDSSTVAALDFGIAKKLNRAMESNDTQPAAHFRSDISYGNYQEGDAPAFIMTVNSVDLNQLFQFT